MAENPLSKLARVVGGVILGHGRLGHQVLGQMLILDSSQVEVAGATLLVAAGSGRRNAAAQIALRTAAPALALQALSRKAERRLARRAAAVTREQKRVESENRALGVREAELERRRAELERAEAERQSSWRERLEDEEREQLEDEERQRTLLRENEVFRDQLATLRAELAGKGALEERMSSLEHEKLALETAMATLRAELAAQDGSPSCAPLDAPKKKFAKQKRPDDAPPSSAEPHPKRKKMPKF
ncbi:MAG TPA: hypothetical protein VGK73_36805 [Polyangiaceae bacterium]